jgi:hypothetical protein
VSRLLQYFDIRSTEDIGGRGLPLGEAVPRGTAWPQWLALFCGVLIQPYFEGYRRYHTWGHFAGFWGWAIFALITSVIIFPGVYRKVVDKDAPVILLLAPIFASGLGWESLLGTAMGVVAGKPLP